MKTKLLVLSIAALCLSAAPAFGDMWNENRQWGSESSLSQLQGVFDDIGSTILAYGDQTNYGIFEPTSASTSQIFVTAAVTWGYPDIEFGIYEYGTPGNMLPIFTLSDAPTAGDSMTIKFNQGLDYVQVVGDSGVVAETTYFKQFGFYSITTTNLDPLTILDPYFSEDELNPYGDAHFLTYESKGELVNIGGTGLYNDIAHWYIAAECDIPTNRTTGADFSDFVVQVESIRPVPVPGAILLGILGLSAAGIKLRKFA
jgi:hypothetical protein